MKTRIAWIQTHEWNDGKKIALEVDDQVISFREPRHSEELWQKVVVIPIEED